MSAYKLMQTENLPDDLPAVVILPLRLRRPALTFDGIPLAYWREEARLGSGALSRLKAICSERGADYELTLARLSLAQREAGAAHMATGDI